MKKLVTIFLAVAMLFAMCIPAFADDAPTNLAITGEGSQGRTYVGYKLLDLTVSHKTNKTNCEKHDDDCYNYAYKIVNDNYRTILQNEVFENKGQNSNVTKATDPTGVTDDEIIAYLAGKTSGKYDGTIRAVADRIYTAIKANAEITPDQTAFEGTASIDQGYWLFADVTPDLANDAYSFVMVDTKGESDLTITPKTALPTITKEVYDVDESTGEEGWSDSADHDITDDVQFKLTATLADNYSYYDTYKLVFHDDLAAGLTLNADTIKVFADGVEITTKATIIKNDLDDGCDFEVVLNDVKTIEGVTVTNDTEFVVTYSATLNEDAVVGVAGNTNTVKLEYSNDPYSGSTGTATANVKVYTYQLVINKVDGEGNPLTGAEFTLSKKNAQGGYDPIATVVKNDEETTFTWTGLDDGDYRLEETVVPAGYNGMAAKEFKITATHNKDGLTLDKPFDDATVTDGTITADIENNTGTILPETGAMGTTLLIAGGAILMMIAGVFMITRKKMSVYED